MIVTQRASPVTGLRPLTRHVEIATAASVPSPSQSRAEAIRCPLRRTPQVARGGLPAQILHLHLQSRPGRPMACFRRSHRRIQHKAVTPPCTVPCELNMIANRELHPAGIFRVGEVETEKRARKNFRNGLLLFQAPSEGTACRNLSMLHWLIRIGARCSSWEWAGWLWKFDRSNMGFISDQLVTASSAVERSCCRSYTGPGKEGRCFYPARDPGILRRLAYSTVKYLPGCPAGISSARCAIADAPRTIWRAGSVRSSCTEMPTHLPVAECGVRGRRCHCSEGRPKE